tara:strand:- start:1421 stop:1966 length:546 start_codon:yes stop_codon:yes gene_type:complete
MNKQCVLQPLIDEHFHDILLWRNAPEVRKNMYTSRIISKDEHHVWFNTLKTDQSKAYFVAIIDQIKSGVIGFTAIDETKAHASWAFYTSPQAKPGSGSIMEFNALNYAFDTLKLQQLNCEVLGFNTKVIKMHGKFGFHVEHTYKHAFFDGNTHHDIVKLSLCKSRWQIIKPEIKNKIRRFL